MNKKEKKLICFLSLFLLAGMVPASRDSSQHVLFHQKQGNKYKQTLKVSYG